jgi:TetR/AcrR family acrAB operon transcriptional repressor
MARRSAEDTAKTRARIVDEALLVFAEQGISASRLEEIARRAGVTRGALYHHFSGKEELLSTVLKERWDSAMEPVLRPLRQERGVPALRAFIEGYLRCVDHDVTVRALLRVSLSGELAAPEAPGLEVKAAVWNDWLELLDRTIKEARETRRRVRTASDCVLNHLIGYALRSALFGPPVQADYHERCTCILGGVLR